MLRTFSWIVLIGFSLFASPAGAQKWDIATAFSEGQFTTKNIQLFAKDVREATNGKLNLVVHPGGSLIKKNTDNRNAIRSGLIPAGEFKGAWMSNENPVWTIDTLPFTATSYDQAEKLWKASRPAIEEALEKQGLLLLFSIPWPPQALFSVKPIETIDDLKGVKFRTYSPITSRFAQLAGAAGTEIQPPLATAFQTGRVEAMITSPPFAASHKAWDYLRYVYDTQAFVPKNYFIVSKRAWRRLDKDTQAAVKLSAAEAERRGWEMSRRSYVESKNLLAKNGMSIALPSALLLDGFKKIGQVMRQDWAGQAGSSGQSILDTYNAMR